MEQINESLPPGYTVLKRDVQGVAVPEGTTVMLSEGTLVRVTQQLGDSFTVMSEFGQLFRMAGDDADALGLPKPAASKLGEGATLEERVDETLRTCYDPEIPVNIVDLGLIYGQEVRPYESGGSEVLIKLTLTAPGCGMSGVLKSDVERKLAALPGVSKVDVEVVFEPAWSQERMSEAAKLQLGML
jgi:probable FeS assembly SUF system protein SufT